MCLVASMTPFQHIAWQCEWRTPCAERYAACLAVSTRLAGDSKPSADCVSNLLHHKVLLTRQQPLLLALDQQVQRLCITSLGRWVQQLYHAHNSLR